MTTPDPSQDRELLRRAEGALTEIKVSAGLSERHQAVLAALRIRLKGVADKSLEEMLEAAGDPDDAGDAMAAPADAPRKTGLDDLLSTERPKGTLDDLLAKEPKKPTWPGE